MNAQKFLIIKKNFSFDIFPLLFYLHFFWWRWRCSDEFWMMQNNSLQENLCFSIIYTLSLNHTRTHTHTSSLSLSLTHTPKNTLTHTPILKDTRNLEMRLYFCWNWSESRRIQVSSEIDASNQFQIWKPFTHIHRGFLKQMRAAKSRIIFVCWWWIES